MSSRSPRVIDDIECVVVTPRCPWMRILSGDGKDWSERLHIGPAIGDDIYGSFFNVYLIA